MSDLDKDITNLIHKIRKSKDFDEIEKELLIVGLQLTKKDNFKEKIENLILDTPRKQVDYYVFNDIKYQYDELFSLYIDIDKTDHNYEKLITIFPDGRQEQIMPIRDIYDIIMSGKWDNKHPQINETYIDKYSIIKTTGLYVPKSLFWSLLYM
ncbi:MAG: hypothetical protein VZS44_12610 [Bacilli bacterium]|nr:hypothetical protein [Bacilli bacterium]